MSRNHNASRTGLAISPLFGRRSTSLLVRSAPSIPRVSHALPGWKMEESNADERKRVLSLHLGALYSSCPAELPLPESTCGVTSWSTRCFLLQELQRRATTVSGVDPAAGSLPVPECSSGSACGPVREVFCRVLPRPPVSPASRTALPLDTANRRENTGSVDTLSEALGLMYGGVHVAFSPRPSAIGAAGPGPPEEGGAAEEKAARPPSSSTLHLVPCNRLHAGLIPLYAPAVEAADGIFLVRHSHELESSSWVNISHLDAMSGDAYPQTVHMERVGHVMETIGMLLRVECSVVCSSRVYEECVSLRQRRCCSLFYGHCCASTSELCAWLKDRRSHLIFHTGSTRSLSPLPAAVIRCPLPHCTPAPSCLCTQLFACLPFRLTALTQLCREVRGARGEEKSAHAAAFFRVLGRSPLAEIF